MRSAREKIWDLWVWRIFLLAGFVALGGYFLLSPGGLLGDSSYDVFGVSAVVAILVGVRWYRPRQSAAWYVFALGISLLVAGDLTWSFYENILGVAAPFPSVADGFYLAAYPMMAASLLMMIHSREAGRDRPALVDTAIISVSGGSLSWVFLVNLYATDPSLSVVERAISVAYPLMDVVLLAAAARLIFAPGWRTLAGYLLICGLLSYMVADLIYSRAILFGAYQTGHPLDAGWLLAYVLFGAAALHPAMRSLTEPEDVPGRDTSFSRGRIAALILASLALPLTLALHEARSGHGAGVLTLALGTGVVFTLVLLRFGDLARRLWIAEHTLAEEKIREAETRYQTLVERVPAITYVQAQEPGETSNSEYISPQIEAVLGYTPEEYTSDPEFWKKILHPDDRERMIAEDKRTGGMGEPFSTEFRVICRDGRTVWLREEGKLLHDEDGGRQLWHGVMFDITELKQTEQALREREWQHRSLIENIPAVTFIHPAGDSEALSYMSPQIESLLGYTPDEYTQAGFWMERLHPDDRERVLAEDERTDKTLEPYSIEYRLRSRAGRYVWVREEAVVVYDEAGAPRYWQGFLWNIADRKEAEEKLGEAERLYRTLIEQIPVVTYMQEIEYENATFYVSPQIETLIGYTPEEYTSERDLWIDVIHPEDAPAVLIGEPYQIEYRMVHRDGRTVWVRDEAAIVHDAEGRPLHWRGIMLDITAQKELERQLSHQASHDALTGLPNRVLFTDRLQHALARTSRKEESLAVLFVDLDNFKNVNDSLGHAVGDKLLREVAERLSFCVRPADTVARLGGDEFAVLIEDFLDISDVPGGPRAAGAINAAIRVAERILEAMESPFLLEGKEVRVRPSIGVATDIWEKRASELLRNADVAMYTAKSKGKGCYEFYDPGMHSEMLEASRLSDDLRRAVEEREFVVHYQPVVALDGSGGVREVEALVRWQHPERGLISPGQFVPLAEQTGTIVEIGYLVLEEACRQVREWQETNGVSLILCVNLSVRQFGQQDLAQQISRILDKTGFPAGLLKLEVTESGAMVDPEQALDTLRRIKDLGIRVAIDDFGTGYSALSQLGRLPVDTLKIDRLFVERLEKDAEMAAIVSTTVKLARVLGLSVTAEGVETAGQLQFLREMGCELAQGYYFARPLPAEEIEELLNVLVAPAR